VNASRLYFDNAATTPTDPRVRAAMQPFLDGAFGNPSSLHAEGRLARAAVERARQRVAALVGAKASEVIFTSGGTEADNLALVGVTRALSGQPVHVVTSAIEHPAILETCRELAQHGVSVSLLGVDGEGAVQPAELDAALRPDTRLVSIMAANNVVGTLQPVRELARITHAHGALFHMDAVQAVGKVPLDMGRDDIDLLSISGHKLHGPKGSGALVVRDGTPLAALLRGGGQEGDRRSGTENVAAIVGLGVAARLAGQEQRDESARVVGLRERLIAGVLATIPSAYLIGSRFRRLPGNVCLGFAGLEGDSIRLMLALDEAGVAVSTGSACSAHKAGSPSHVLTAMGFDAYRARGGLRITLGRFNTEADVERLLEILPRAVAELSPVTSRARKTTGVVQ
jgi:cysteine desulfurase